MTGLEVEFLPVGEKFWAGDAIAIRYGEPNNFQLIVVKGKEQRPAAWRR